MLGREISSGVAVRDACGVSSAGRLVGERNKIVHLGTNEYALRFDVHCFLWPRYYMNPPSCM